MANYNANAMAAYQQYGQSMIAGGGGSNMSGTGSSTMQVFNAMRDDDDKPSGLASKPTTTKDKKPSFWDRITSVFQENEVDVTNVYKPSVDPSNVYTQKMFEMVPSASDYVYRAEMSDQTQDMVEQAMGYEVPKLGQLQMIDEGPMSAEEKKQFGPLMKMADDIRNPNITTEELPDIELDQDAAVTDALMQGQPTGLMSRPSSFTGEGVQVASLDMGKMTPQQLEDYYAGVASGTIDPETGQAIQSAEDVDRSTSPIPQLRPDDLKIPTKKHSGKFDNKNAFLKAIIPAAKKASARTGVDWRMIVAQSAIETGWGSKVKGNSFFGIKGHGAKDTVKFTTQEEVDGKRVTIQDSFRAYDSLEDSVSGYADFLLSNPRYTDYMAAGNLEDAAAALQASGYATDSSYGSKVLSTAKGKTLRNFLKNNPEYK